MDFSGITHCMDTPKTKKITRSFRPPIVAILGHVDHGKTTLLDAIRNTSVTQKEAGGITQHIGASQVIVKGAKSSDQTVDRITFLDTPGHEAFAKMRSRGAQAADIAVLVVAANDGVKPQTKEAISHIKESKVPLIVAVNKIDLPDIDLQKVYGQLAREEILVESLGGKIASVELSAKTKKGIDQLLEVILLLAQIKEIKGDPAATLSAIVIETRHDKHKGMLATLVIKDGILKVGDTVFAEDIKVKVKSMIGSDGKSLPLALPGTPVEVMGWDALPKVGATVGVDKELIGKKIATPESNYQYGLQTVDTETKLKLILKADTLGTLEAIKETLKDEVEWIGFDSGEIVESDVLMAKTTGAFIIGFNVGAASRVKKLAEVEQVRLKTYSIIYELIDEIREVISLLKEPSQREKILGEAVVVAEFTAGDDRVAGCKIKSGKISRGDTVRVMRGDETLGLSKIKSLRQGKEDVPHVTIGTECGIVMAAKLDFRPADLIISYKKQDLLV